MLNAILGGISLGSSLWSGMTQSKAQKKAEKENRQRIAEATGILTKLGQKYRPEGVYGRALYGQAKSAKASAIGSETMRAIQSGIAGTTYGGQVEQRYETQTGANTRMKISDFLTDKYSQVEREKSNLLMNTQTIGPSYADIMNAYSGSGAAIGTILKDLFGKKKGKNAETLTSDLIGSRDNPKLTYGSNFTGLA